MGQKRTIILAGVAVILACLWVGLAWHDEARAVVGWVMERLREAGPGTFFCAMALLPLFGFPLMPFTLAAGPVFGERLGVPLVIGCAVAAVAANVAIAYVIATRALRPVLGRLLAKFGWKMPEGPVRSSLELTLLLRVVPGTPFFAQSYLLGLARVPFGLYLGVSVGVPASFIAATILAGDAFGRGDHSGLVTAGVICGVAGAGLHFFRRRLKRKFREREV
jgi:uncharacterized membrane protein YdjX (TVP38/TMEM64 family)